MLVWRGYGLLIAVISFLCLLGAKAAAEGIWGTPVPIEKFQYCEFVAMLVAAGAVFLLNKKLLKSSPPKTLIDKATGKEVILFAKHDLFFIPLKYWPYILVVLGILFGFQR